MKLASIIRLSQSILLTLIPLVCQGQNANDSISEIKMNGERYWYAEATASLEETSLKNASTLLLDVIREDLSVEMADDQRQSEARRLAESALSIKTTRGPLKRTFLYVVKPNSNGQDSLNVASLKSSADKLEMDDYEGMKMHIETVQDEIEVEVAQQEKIFDRNELEEDMMKIRSAKEIENFVKTKKDQGKVQAYGKMKNIPLEGISMVFVFNQEYEIVGYLRKNDEKYINLINGEATDIANYKGCGGIWIK